MEFINEYGNVIGIAALLFFFLFFIGVLAWVYRPGAKDKYKKWSRIPLNNGDGKEAD